MKIRVMTSKDTLRKEIANTLSSLNEEIKKEEDQKIFEQVIHSRVFQDAKTIFSFVSTNREVDTHEIIKEAWKQGKTVCVPKCFKFGQMKAYQIHSMDDLKVGKYGILEPTSTIEIKPEDLDLVLVPCCSASKDGKRLGYGGGFYDRYLAQTNAKKMVLCRKSLMREDIPMDTYDQKMDYVCNEDEIIRIYKAILFDKDGTLFDTEKYYQKAWYTVCDEIGIECTKEVQDALYGRSGIKQVEALHQVEPDIDANYFCERLLEVAHEDMKNGIDIKPGVKETLEYFYKKGIPLAIASGGPMAVIKENLEQAQFTSYFSALSSGLEVERGKPYPDIYWDVCKKLKVQAENCLVFEDSPAGVQSAKAAGCTVIMIPETKEALKNAEGYYDEWYESFEKYLEIK